MSSSRPVTGSGNNTPAPLEYMLPAPQVAPQAAQLSGHGAVPVVQESPLPHESVKHQQAADSPMHPSPPTSRRGREKLQLSCNLCRRRK